MVEKKTIKNTNSNIRKGKSKTKARNKIGNLSGGAVNETITKSGTFTIIYNERSDVRLNLTRPEDSKFRPQPTKLNQSDELKNLKDKVDSYQNLEYLKTFLTHEITYVNSQSRGGAVRTEIEQGKYEFIYDVIDRNIDYLIMLNDEDNKDAEVLFVFKGNKTPKKIGTVEEFNRIYAICISTQIGDKLKKDIESIIKKTEQI